MAGAGKGGKSGGGMPVLGKGARGAGGGPGLGLWLGLAALVIVLDQLTKTLVIVSFTLGDSLRVTDFFNLVRIQHVANQVFRAQISLYEFVVWILTNILVHVCLVGAIVHGVKIHNRVFA